MTIINQLIGKLMKVENSKFVYKREEDAAYIRRSVKLTCLRIGFDSHETDSIQLMLTEMLTNVSKHGGGFAHVTVEVIKSHNKYRGVKIIVEDQGPGIMDVDKAILDGYSTSGSLGLGLGAIKRLSDQYHIDTRTGESGTKAGTTIQVHKYLKSSNYSSNFRKQIPDYVNNTLQKKSEWKITGQSRKRYGSRYNGDMIYWNNNGHIVNIALIDGVGHGHSAYRASNICLKSIKKHIDKPLKSIMGLIHEELSSTVGCQVILLRINKSKATVEYNSVGNIRAFFIIGSSIKSLLTKDGTIGRTKPNLKTEMHDVNSRMTILLHSDGYSRSWIYDYKYQRGSQHPGSVFLSNLLRKYRKKYDDSSFVIAQNF